MKAINSKFIQYQVLNMRVQGEFYDKRMQNCHKSTRRSLLYNMLTYVTRL